MAVFKTADTQVVNKGPILVYCDACKTQYPSHLESCPHCSKSDQLKSLRTPQVGVAIP